MKLISSIVAVLLVGIVCSTSSAQQDASRIAGAPSSAQEDKDAGAPAPKVAQVLQHALACPSDMVEVEGDYCPDLEQHCKYNTGIDGKVLTNPDGSVKKADLTWACGEYEPSTCKSDHLVHMHFCIDKYEWPNKEGQIPQDWMTWYDAKKAVESVGKRLCTHREWTLAAEGPNMHPLPYGDGYHRDKGICNFDRKYSEVTETDAFKALGIRGINVEQSKRPDDAMSKALRMFLVPSGSKPDCASDYGVHDMSGNIDEWVVNESSNLMACPPEVIKAGKCMQMSYHSGLMGGHVWHVRNASRPMTTAHYPGFGWYETGTRACKDIQ